MNCSQFSTVYYGKKQNLNQGLRVPSDKVTGLGSPINKLVISL